MADPSAVPSLDAACHAPGGEVRFRRFHWLRHLLFFTLLACLCALMYHNALMADFQYDDEPNITKADEIKIDALTWKNVKYALTHHPAKNRILVTLSYVLQYRAAGFLPRVVDDEEPHPALLSWQFRLFNYTVHLLAGLGVYFLYLRLLQLPRLRGRFEAHLWPLAALGALVWFCCPIHTQSVTYIVQRATSMAGMFYVWALVCYLEGRAAESRRGQAAFFAVAFLSSGCAVFSKEWGATLPVTMIVIEFLLIGRRHRTSLRYMGLVLLIYGTAALIGLTWFYGRKKEKGASVVTAAERLYDDAVGRVLRDEAHPKIKISPRQRLMTEARVVAMYQSLVFFPAPWRLILDYDFLETTQLFHPDEISRPLQWAPLVLVLGAAALVLIAPARQRVRVLLLLLVALTAYDQVALALDYRQTPLSISNVWSLPWSVPAFCWHALVFGFAMLYAYRRPLIAFGILFFYLGHLVESTIICLEVVYEHRLYLPSVGFILALLLLVYDAFRPAPEERLDPPPLARLA